jgi:phosphoribosylamine--glycine ligase
MKTLIVGHGGREAALGSRMAQDSVLSAFMSHPNPSITEQASRSGGVVAIGDVCDGAAVARFAIEQEIDLAMVSSDAPLEAGVVDALQAGGIDVVGPTRLGSQIEWDKEFCRAVVDVVAPAANPRFRFVRTPDQIGAAIDAVSDAGRVAVVIKPVGLSGGKGVKVVGPHLADNQEAAAYAGEVITAGRHGGAVLVEERIDSPEFTIQAMTDGTEVVFPPCTYDYPYRFDGDNGPGTGGMGSYSLAGGLLPFVDTSTKQRAQDIICDVIGFLKREGRPFTGCLNAGFFATPEGLRVIEFNARFGDPECLNIMSLLDGSWTGAMAAMVSGRLGVDDVSLGDDSSIVLYLVAPEYALGESRGHDFEIHPEVEAGVQVLFASAIQRPSGGYTTVGSSRTVALVARHHSLDVARRTVYSATSGVVGDLQFRSDIGLIDQAPSAAPIL